MKRDLNRIRKVLEQARRDRVLDRTLGAQIFLNPQIFDSVTTPEAVELSQQLGLNPSKFIEVLKYCRLAETLRAHGVRAPD